MAQNLSPFAEEQYVRFRLFQRGVSAERGFLGFDDPLIELPREYHEPFARHLLLGEEMPECLLMGGDVYARRVRELPVVSGELLDYASDRVLHRLAVTLSFLVQAYIWQDRRNPRTILPASLAVPMHRIGQLLDVAPLLIYQFYTLQNWQRIFPEDPIEIENVKMIQNFNSKSAPELWSSEEWFVGVHVKIEQIAGNALLSAGVIQCGLDEYDFEIVRESLRSISETLARMEQTLARMNEHCHPEIYYHHVRPYLFGWYTVPGGVTYEGVPEFFGGGQLFRGQTGAQSSIAPLLDALLCIPHNDRELSSHLKTMLEYHTPKNHRAMIVDLISSWQMREEKWKILFKHAETRDRYVEVRRALASFRRQHYDHALTYIAKPARREREESGKGAGVIIPGTGGSDLIRSLKLHVAETLHPDERESVMRQYEAHWKNLYHS